MKNPPCNSKVKIFATILRLCVSAFLTTSAADLYLPIYSQTCGQMGLPLHIIALDPQTLISQGQWNFPAEYTGHRSVCRLPGANTNSAFVGWTGATPYNPSAGGQYGFSAASDTPMLGLDFGSSATQMYGDYSPFFSMRFDLWAAGTMEINSTGGVRTAATQLDSTSSLRIRVVRWKVDDVRFADMNLFGETVPNRVILDKVINPAFSTTITEADFIDHDSFDIDWDWSYHEVVTNELVELCCSSLVKFEYLVMLGYSPYAWWDSERETNKWLWASRHVITRFYGESRINPLPLPLPISAGRMPTFEWTLDCPEREAYTACRVRLHGAGGTVVRETDIMRMPPNINAADPRHGRYRWTAPADWLADITNAAAWSVAAYNSKFRNESAVTNTAAITWTPNPETHEN